MLVGNSASENRVSLIAIISQEFLSFRLSQVRSLCHREVLVILVNFSNSTSLRMCPSVLISYTLKEIGCLLKTLP